MSDIKTSDRLLIVGKTRSGKTFFMRSLLHMFPRVILHDRKNEHGSLMNTLHFTRVTTPEQLQKAIDKGFKRMLYMPADPGPEDFDVVCKITYYTSNITLVVDEIASYTTSSMIPFYLGECLRLGAGRGIGLVMLSQRPRAIYNTLLSESEHIFAFRLNLKTDRDKLKEIVGTEVELLQKIPYYHYLYYDGDNVQWCSPIPVK